MLQEIALLAGHFIEQWMSRYERIACAERVMRTARPRKLKWMLYESRPHWIEFDIPVAGEQVGFAVDQA
jgi:hypothetical protein